MKNRTIFYDPFYITQIPSKSYSLLSTSSQHCLVVGECLSKTQCTPCVHPSWKSCPSPRVVIMRIVKQGGKIVWNISSWFTMKHNLYSNYDHVKLFPTQLSTGRKEKNKN